MPEAGRRPPIDLRLRVRGKKKSERIIIALREQFGVEVEIVEDDDDVAVPVRETDWWKQTPLTAGGIIDSLRWQKRISQAELARRAGTTRQTISAIERGKRKMGQGMLARIVAALEVPVERLIPRS